MLLSVESPHCGSLCTWAFRGHAAALQRSGASSPAGVGWEHVQTDNRGSPGTWENPVRSSANPGWRYRVTNSRPWRRTCPPGSESNECNRGTAKRRTTKCGGMAAGRHSVLIVPTKLANSTRLEPVEESETPIHGTVFEKHDECIEIRQSCPRNRNG
jgi:hypothetical protein